MFVDSDRKSVFSRYPRKYPRGESNPYQKFRKLLFYPLNYRTNQGANIGKIFVHTTFYQVVSFIA